ncbi:hypothetical protein FACS189472_10900 [Alphaproteobacteria bacterium]|nr:hypothetical protein FACS189472_10900 [Alphaproteobacteria bacterium]
MKIIGDFFADISDVSLMFHHFYHMPLWQKASDQQVSLLLFSAFLDHASLLYEALMFEIVQIPTKNFDNFHEAAMTSTQSNV